MPKLRLGQQSSFDLLREGGAYPFARLRRNSIAQAVEPRRHVVPEAPLAAIDANAAQERGLPSTRILSQYCLEPRVVSTSLALPFVAGL